MKPNKLSIILYLIMLLSSCHSSQDELMLARLKQLDTLIENNPEDVRDSLLQITPSKLSRYNNAYHGLLKTISDDKTYVEFTSDSLINETEKYWQRHQKGSELHIRSLIYQSIVRYRMGIKDSTAFVPLKEAEQLYNNLNKPKSNVGYYMYYYLGKTLENDNVKQATDYYKKALQLAEKENEVLHIFDTTLALFWNQMENREYNNANIYLEQLEKNLTDNIDEQYYFLNAKSIYLNTQHEYEKALEINKKRIQLLSQVKEKTEIFKLYYSIADDYLSINQLDSAISYIEKSIEHIPDSNYILNQLIYEKAAEISEIRYDYISANNYRKKLLDVKNKTISQERNTTIVELEKKYNHATSENKIIREKAKNKLYFSIIILLILTTIVLINHLNQKKKTSQSKILAIRNEKIAEELKHKLLENESKNLRIENEKKELTNELYNQMLSHFFELENELRKIVDKSRLTNPDFADLIDGLRNTMSNKLIDSFADKITHKEFTSLTGVTLPTDITNSEFLMLFLINSKLSNKEMSIVFKTTPSSIRSRKHLLKKKMSDSGADISFFDK